MNLLIKIFESLKNYRSNVNFAHIIDSKTRTKNYYLTSNRCGAAFVSGQNTIELCTIYGLQDTGKNTDALFYFFFSGVGGCLGFAWYLFGTIFKADAFT